MFDIAWSEMLVIGAVALVVIGPKDLPKALRSVGEAVGKIKRMAAEFQGQFNDAMREAELHDLKKQVEDVGGSVQAATKVDFNPIQTIREELKGTTTVGAVAGSAAPMALATDATGMMPTADPVIPLPEPPPPFDPASLIEAVPEPEPVSKPKRARKKPVEADGSAA
ncbi:MAG: Sec-independent protein translocase protein TatB [Bosea sp. (in: a-proteobacteria)]